MLNRRCIGDSMALNLFGTDGIRGKVNLKIKSEKTAITKLLDEREFSPPILRLIGESLGRTTEDDSNGKQRVVIGWDDRPANEELASHLTVGLNLAEFEVIHIGMCATPLLHYATLHFEATYGCMITASHNPVEDSGIKIFTEFGYKTTPEFESELSRNAISLSQEEREIDRIDWVNLEFPAERFEAADWCLEHHPAWLSRRRQELERLTNTVFSSCSNIAQPLLIDSSRGTGQFWLADWLTQNGMPAVEVSQSASALNDNCGAGDFSPTEQWTFAEAKASNHILIRQLTQTTPGVIVAAALDGDGDRCLLIEATATGFSVIDGDKIADTFVNCVTNAGLEWHLAASIESDLSLTSNLGRFPKPVSVSETAVGDRWLSVKLSEQENHQFKSGKSQPKVIGVEDSGHVVLASPHPKLSEKWSLVGDGAMTLIAYLLAFSNHESSTAMRRGWKLRQSVKHVERSKWDGNNQLSDMVEDTLRTNLLHHAEVTKWKRQTVAGEKNLMLISCLFNGAKLSIGIRNSGTQAKISVSARLEHGGSNDGIEQVMGLVCNMLAKHMTNH